MFALRSIFRSALRSARRRPGFAALNVVGLAVGLACWMLIALYVHDEATADRFHERADRIVRVSQEVTVPGREALWSRSGGALGEVLEADLAPLDAVVRVLPQAGPVRAEGGGAERFREPGFVFADEDFFEVFSYPFLRGTPETALRQPNAVVLTASAAARYFGDADPVGRALTYGSGREVPLVVSAVIADPPSSAHLPLSLVAPMAAFKALNGYAADAPFTSYWWPSVWTYALLQPGTEAAALQAEMGPFITRHRGDADYLPVLEPLADLRFSVAESPPTPTVSRTLVRTFAVIAFAVLLLACVNVVNLTTAQASTRVREVGVRKAVGAGRASLGALFVGEAVLLCAAAFVVALVLVAATLPTFNAVMGKGFDMGLLARPATWAVLAALVVGTGVVAGAYPALVLSGFRPARALRGAFVAGRGARLRKGLIVAQFAITIALAASAAVAFEQIRYLREAPLGFDQEEIVTLRLPGGDYEALRAALEARPEVVAATGAASRPGFGATRLLPYQVEGEYPPAGDGPELGLEYVDYGYVEALGLDVVAGRAFDPAFPGDEGSRMDSTNFYRVAGRGLLVNQAAVRHLGWTDEEALGKSMRFVAFENGTYYTDLRGTVVGVVSDFHVSSFEQELQPLAFTLTASPYGNAPAWALVEVRPGNAARTVGALRAVWDEVHPEAPFEASFLSSDLDARYVSQDRLAATLAGFAWMGGLIACLGLFGLAAFAAERRRKELGVRKVLGAGVGQLVALLTREFVGLVALACVLAVPLAWWASSRWLDGFAYRIDLGPAPFVLAGLLALAVTVATVSARAWAAASADPVRALRSE